MSAIVLDRATIAKLSKVTDRVDLADENGQVVGRFEPAAYATEPQWDEEELLRDERERGGRPLADIVADWKRQI